MNTIRLPRARRRRAAILLTGAATVLLAACAAIRPARMVLPAGLAERSEIVEVRDLGLGERGRSEVLGQTLRFERSATRLAFFDELAVTDRANVRFSLEGGAAGRSDAHCGMRRRTAGVGVVEFVAKPLFFACDFAPLGAALVLQEGQGGPRTLTLARQGTLRFGGRELALRSVHEAEGAMVALPQPIGYLVEEGGRAVAAVEVNGPTPTLYLPRGDAALRSASLHALLALALLWEPADG